jgi:class 3 adenylate cyclase
MRLLCKLKAAFTEPSPDSLRERRPSIQRPGGPKAARQSKGNKRMHLPRELLRSFSQMPSWQEKSLPGDSNIRIALHAGPAYEFDDPITGKRTYGGTHVSRAARIEPITPRGHVYASEAFAAIAAARNADSFVCDYVGQTPLAKEYGTLPMYHIRRRW